MIFSESGIRCQITDERHHGQDIDTSFNGKLRPDQEQASYDCYE